jgi:hypothetical protein
MRGLPAFLILALAGPLGTIRGEEPMPIAVREHKGRPMVFIGGQPQPLPTYSPAGWRKKWFEDAVPRFYPHRMGAYFICMPHAKKSKDFFETPFWRGDEVSETPLAEAEFSMDEQARQILEGDPGAYLIVRFGPNEPQSWRDLHPDELFVTDQGEKLQIPSLASELYWDFSARFSRAVIRYCESRPWGKRVIGYWNGHRVEGIHEPLIQRWLMDHSPVMTARWRQYLKEKYETVAALRKAHGDPKLEFETAAVPCDKLRGAAPEVAKLLYWQAPAGNQPLRDYLELTRDLFHHGFRKLAQASREATPHPRFLIYDALKQTMHGWDNWGFFKADESWPFAFPDELAGSGHLQVAKLYDAKGFDGLITPHDYQARGVGGIYEPEGIVDSTILRGKLFFCEMDTRTYTGQGEFGRAENDREFAAITWRNLATALARGFNSYWMDLCSDWYGNDRIHAVIQRQVEVVKESVNWPHETVPGIAMVLDDSAVLETNGAGNFYNEAILWEQKMGLARCGVPYRIYLLEDLALPNFPKHRVYYFPNLFRVDDERRELLEKKVFRDGNVVVWGPGSGISDGKKLGPKSAEKLTGFAFEYWPVNYPRRALISNFDHPLTKGFPPDTVFGGPLAYGPMLFPKDGTPLARTWTKEGRNYCGLAVKTFGKGPRGVAARPEKLGEGDYAAVFSTFVPLPAELWRATARWAGAHVYSDGGDVLVASRHIVALHTLQSGEKRIALPEECAVRDLVADRPVSPKTREIVVRLEAPATCVFLLEPIPAR